MSGLPQSVLANEDHLITIYRRTGDTPFTYGDIADLIPRGVMLRYTVPGIFMPARDAKGNPIKAGSRSRATVWRWHPRAAELCRRAIERDHRWENLAAGLTGGSECA
jgi:hypothetical protein